MRFAELNLAPQILEALAACGDDQPTPIQAQTIPALLAGRDVIGSAQTGTGKTAAFVLPALHRLAQNPQPSAARHRLASAPRVLVLAPTRELAQQVAEQAVRYGQRLRVTTVCLYGGAVPGAEPAARARRGPAGGHPRPAARPRRARPRRPHAPRSAGARRGRPHARPGLRRRRRARVRVHASDPADRALLGDVRRRGRPPRREARARSGARRRPQRARGAARHRAARPLRRRPRAQEPAARPPARRRGDAAEHRVHRDQARRRGAGRPAAGRGPCGRPRTAT